MTIRKRTNPDYQMGTLSERMSAKLEAQGLRLPVKPPGTLPDLPKDVTALSDVDLMALYAEFVGWGEYAETQAAAAVVDERHAERRVASAISRGVAQNMDAGMRATEARAAAKEAVAQEEKDVLDAEAYRKMVEAVSSSCDKSASLISRELSRRLSQVDQNRRTGKRFAP